MSFGFPDDVIVLFGTHRYVRTKLYIDVIESKAKIKIACTN